MSKTEGKNSSQVHKRDNIANVLIVDGDPNAARFLLEILARKGIRGHLANNEVAALDFVEKGTCDLVFTSERIPKRASARGRKNRTSSRTPGIDVRDDPLAVSENGFDLLRKIRANSPELPVIMMGEPHSIRSPQQKNTQCVKADLQNQQDPIVEEPHHYLLRWGIQAAVRAMHEGCSDFLIKPLDRERIENLLDTLLPNHRVSTIASAQEDTHCLYEIVGRSPSLKQAISLAQKVAPSSAPVLISGESGTGKELVSYLIHHQSRRTQGPYTRVNCAALSDSLLESELFGHEKGAFTGAYAQRKGRFETAHGGTLLLDEITETPPRFQAKLLRVLEQQDFERVGGNENVSVDVRIISTTNKDLPQEVQEGRFRPDLYYRLSGIRLAVPPLRERKEDLPDLVWHFINLYAREVQRHITGLDPMTMDIFAKYSWPGNVRQLRNVVRTSLILGVGETLSLADVSWLFDESQPLEQEKQCGLRTILSGGGSESHKRDSQQACDALPRGNSRQTHGRVPEPVTSDRSRMWGLGGLPLEQVERQAILDTLRQTGGNQTKAAKMLGISDRTLRDKIRRYRREGCLQST
ncbi:MAG: sigma-54-dependent transcriptional regulator [Planctomycetota bacterium]